VQSLAIDPPCSKGLKSYGCRFWKVHQQRDPGTQAAGAQTGMLLFLLLPLLPLLLLLLLPRSLRMSL
jgi:hypothetical protein